MLTIAQMLKFIHEAAPIAVYTSGKGSSAAGLTASVIRGGSGELHCPALSQQTAAALGKHGRKASGETHDDRFVPTTQSHGCFLPLCPSMLSAECLGSQSQAEKTHDDRFVPSC